MEDRKSVRIDMRRLAHMYILFIKKQGVVNENGDASDTFNRVNFVFSRQKIDLYTLRDDTTLKAGLKQNLYYLLKRAEKIIKGS